MRCQPILVVAISSLAMAACDSSSRATAVDLSGRSPAAASDFFPLMPGATWVYAGHDHDVPVREEVRVDDVREQILGVDCAALRQQVFRDDELVEIATEYLARDEFGNLWKFGEVGFSVADGGLVPIADSWLAGKDGAEPWILIPARPSAGEVWHGETPHERETFLVLSVAACASVPAGEFADCLEIREENDDPEDADIVLYAPGVGPVARTSPTSTLQLTSSRRP
jgi:hypothetical protein